MTANQGVLRLHHVSLSTPDLQSALAFYRDLLGGEVAHEFRNEAGELYGAFVHCGHGTFVELFQDAVAVSSQPSRFRHLSFEVEDIEAAAARLRSKGYTPGIRRGRTDQVLQLFIDDADGNKVELQQHDEQSALKQYLTKNIKPRGWPAVRVWALLSGIFVALFIADFALRFVDPMFDPDRQFRMIPGIGSAPTLAPENSTLWQRSIWGNYALPVEIDRYGLRERKSILKADKSAIFVVGDQFPFGAGVPEDKRFSNLLEFKLGVPVYNIAMRGILPWGHFKLVRYAEQIVSYANESEFKVGRLVFVLPVDNQVNRYQDMASGSVGAAVDAPAKSRLGAFESWAEANSALAMSAQTLIFTYGLSGRYGILHAPGVYRMLRAVHDFMFPRAKVPLSVPADYDESVRQTLIQLGKIAALRDVLFVIVPAPNQFMPDELFSESAETYTRMHDVFIAAMAHSGLTFVDLAPAFARTHASQEVLFPHDLQWTPAAHVAAAEALVPAIVAKWKLTTQ
jgi:glyoxylase I family protein